MAATWFDPPKNRGNTRLTRALEPIVEAPNNPSSDDLEWDEDPDRPSFQNEATIENLINKEPETTLTEE